MADEKQDGGRRSWFERHVLRHRDALRSYLLGLTRSKEDAEDIEQEALIRLYSVENPDRIENPRAFLFATAHNLFVQSYRKKRNSPVRTVEDLARLSVKEMCVLADDQVIARERLAAFGEAIDQLPPQARRVFIMKKVFGLSHREISQALGVSPKTVEKHVGKGLTRCRDYLRERALYWDEDAAEPSDSEAVQTGESET